MIEMLSLLAVVLGGTQATTPLPPRQATPLEKIEPEATSKCQLEASQGVLLAWQGDTATVRIEARDRMLKLLTIGLSDSILWRADEDDILLVLKPAPALGEERRTATGVQWPVRVDLAINGRLESCEAIWTCAT